MPPRPEQSWSPVPQPPALIEMNLFEFASGQSRLTQAGAPQTLGLAEKSTWWFAIERRAHADSGQLSEM